MDNINFSRIHFNEQNVNQTSSIIVMKIKDNKKGSVSHSPTSIDRCCKRFMVEPNISSIKDGIPRVPCNITKEEFYLQYVRKRKAVILRGCQKNWRARNWTFEGTFQLNSYFYCTSIIIRDALYTNFLQRSIFIPRNIESVPS